MVSLVLYYLCAVSRLSAVFEFRVALLVVTLAGDFYRLLEGLVTLLGVGRT